MAFVMMLVMFQWLIPSDASKGVLMVCLPVFGFFTVGMHAGYAVYFPELYPTRLRGTGTGFCFNMGRLGTAAAFFGFAAMASPPTPETKAMWLAPLFLLGVVVVLFAKETRDDDLPEEGGDFSYTSENPSAPNLAKRISCAPLARVSSWMKIISSPIRCASM